EDVVKAKTITGFKKEFICLSLFSLTQDTKDNMPNITILGSGGGLRAMIALQGTLVEMKKQGLLDAVLHLCGVSGSTWCMSTLYKDKNWTEKVQDLEECLCDTLSKSSWDLHKAYSLVCQAAKDELFSLTDVWASFVPLPISSKRSLRHLSISKERTSRLCKVFGYPFPIKTSGNLASKSLRWFWKSHSSI
uniref:PLA2c domain-containing protein n=1 Tax=Gopherus evgoodei TaxID=1825980 RepID=A0A8C4YS26_9SAUR